MGPSPLVSAQGVPDGAPKSFGDKIKLATDQLKEQFFAASLKPVHDDALKSEFEGAKSSGSADAQAWKAYDENVRQFNAFLDKLPSFQPQEINDAALSLGKRLGVADSLEAARKYQALRGQPQIARDPVAEQNARQKQVGGILEMIHPAAKLDLVSQNQAYDNQARGADSGARPAVSAESTPHTVRSAADAFELSQPRQRAPVVGAVPSPGAGKPGATPNAAYEYGKSMALAALRAIGLLPEQKPKLSYTRSADGHEVVETEEHPGDETGKPATVRRTYRDGALAKVELPGSTYAGRWTEEGGFTGTKAEGNTRSSGSWNKDNILTEGQVVVSDKRGRPLRKTTVKPIRDKSGRLIAREVKVFQASDKGDALAIEQRLAPDSDDWIVQKVHKGEKPKTSVNPAYARGVDYSEFGFNDGLVKKWMGFHANSWIGDKKTPAAISIDPVSHALVFSRGGESPATIILAQQTKGGQARLRDEWWSSQGGGQQLSQVSEYSPDLQQRLFYNHQEDLEGKAYFRSRSERLEGTSFKPKTADWSKPEGVKLEWTAWDAYKEDVAEGLLFKYAAAPLGQVVGAAGKVIVGGAGSALGQATGAAEHLLGAHDTADLTLFHSRIEAIKAVTPASTLDTRAPELLGGLLAEVSDPKTRGAVLSDYRSQYVRHIAESRYSGLPDAMRKADSEVSRDLDTLQDDSAFARFVLERGGAQNGLDRAQASDSRFLRTAGATTGVAIGLGEGVAGGIPLGWAATGVSAAGVRLLNSTRFASRAASVDNALALMNTPIGQIDTGFGRLNSLMARTAALDNKVAGIPIKSFLGMSEQPSLPSQAFGGGLGAKAQAAARTAGLKGAAHGATTVVFGASIANDFGQRVGDFVHDPSAESLGRVAQSLGTQLGFAWAGAKDARRREAAVRAAAEEPVARVETRKASGVERLRSRMAKEGLDLSAKQEIYVSGVDRKVAELNRDYDGAGYHGKSHQVGETSVVGNFDRETIPRPEGMSPERFQAALADLRPEGHVAASIHDVAETVIIESPEKGGGKRYSVKYSDATNPKRPYESQVAPKRLEKVDIGSLGEPIKVLKEHPDGTRELLYAKAEGTRSHLPATWRTLHDNNIKVSPAAKYIALGTAFSPEEIAFRKQQAPRLRRQITEQYGDRAPDILAVADKMAERLGAVDFFNHYIRPNGLDYGQSLQDEFQDPYVKVNTTFGFFGMEMGGKPSIVNTPEYVEYCAGLPKSSRRNLVSNLLDFRVMAKRPEFQQMDMKAVAQALDRNPQLRGLRQNVDRWADMPIADAYKEIAALDAETIGNIGNDALSRSGPRGNPARLEARPSTTAGNDSAVKNGLKTLKAAMARMGVSLDPATESRVADVDGKVVAANRDYKGSQAYHGQDHQANGSSDVAANFDREIFNTDKPEGMNPEVFRQTVGMLKPEGHMAARIHDAAATVVIESPEKGGGKRYSLKYSDSTNPKRPYESQVAPKRLEKARLDELGDPLKVLKVHPDGTREIAYAKAPGTRSYLPATWRAMHDLGIEASPVAKYIALGTAFSPEEIAFRKQQEPRLRRQIAERYGDKAPDVLAVADKMAERLGSVDFFNHYIRPNGLDYNQSLQDEFQDPYVKTDTTFGFFGKGMGGKPSVVENPEYAKYCAGLPASSRRNLVSNLLDFRVMAERPEFQQMDMKDVARALETNPQMRGLRQNVQRWAAMPIADAYREIAALDADTVRQIGDNALSRSKSRLASVNPKQTSNTEGSPQPAAASPLIKSLPVDGVAKTLKPAPSPLEGSPRGPPELGVLEKSAPAPLNKQGKKISAGEAEIDKYLIARGHSVGKNPLEGVPGAGRQGDRFVDGMKTEYKTVKTPDASPKTIVNHVSDSIRHGGQARQMIFDVRGTKLTRDQALFGMQRALNVPYAKERLERIRVIGKDFDETMP